MENGNGHTILIIDDEPDMLALLSTLLSTQGYRVRTAGTGGEGFAMAQDPAVDLVLLDVMLPDMEGFDVCLKIKEQRPLLPVIHLTARDQPIDMVTGLDSGADDYIIKPFTKPVLLARIRANLRGRQERNDIPGSPENGESGIRVSTAVRTVAQSLTRLLQADAIADTVVQHVGSVLEVKHQAVCIWRQEANDTTRAHLSVSDAKIERVLQSLDWEWDQRLYDELYAGQQPIVTNGARTTSSALLSLQSELDSCTALVAPLLGQNRLYGALILLRNLQSTFSAEERDLVGAIAYQVGIALDYARLLSEIERVPQTGPYETQPAPEILSIISHELRSPVAAIKGFITTLLSNHRLWDDHECEAFLGHVNESVDQLSRLIENVLEMGRLDRGLEPHRRPTQLASLVQRVLHDLSFQSGLCKLVNEVPADLPAIDVDPLRIERVLRNLLENALKFSPRGGRIRVFTRQRDTELEIGIEDQGFGIPAQHLPHIFERFYQVDHKEVSKEGVGLGLSIVKELIHAHGGRIWAESILGSGTTIRFTLPMNDSSRTAEHSLTNSSPSARNNGDVWSCQYRRNGHGMVLIVEDDQGMLQALRTALRDEGFATLDTSYGDEVIELVESEKPDLILLDLTLPDIDGLTVCEQVRQFSDVPIIITTGKTAEHLKVRGLALGADDYVVKPFNNKELLARIKAVLRRAQMPGGLDTHDPLHFNGLEVHPTRQEVKTAQGAVRLTPTEHKLLYFLASNAGQTLTHQQLLYWGWGYESDHTTDNLWVHISRLRKKIEPDPGQPRYILTEPELGYRFVDPGRAA